MNQSKNEELMNILGLSRRAGILLIGQDQVLAGDKHNEKLVVIVTSDCSVNVLRSLKPRVERGEVVLLKLEDTDRTALGSHLGVGSAQIAALPHGGLAKKVLAIYDRSDANEQNQSL
jgi:ribosomal protein L7Ae-like RNA K-turn-binding protein